MAFILFFFTSIWAEKNYNYKYTKEREREIKSGQLLILWLCHLGAVAFIAEVFLKEEDLDGIGMNSSLLRSKRKFSPLCNNCMLCSIFKRI